MRNFLDFAVSGNIASILLQNALCRFRFPGYGFYALTYETSLGRVLAHLVTFRLRDVAGMSPGCRRDVAGMSPFGNSHGLFAKKIQDMRFFRQNSIFYGVTINVGAIRRVRYL